MPSQKPTDLHTSVIPFLEMSGQGLPIEPHLGLIKVGNYNPIPIDRVNKLFSNNTSVIYC